jgi:hypothetical protein
MAVRYLTGLNVSGNINLNSNQLQNVVIQPLGADPAGIAGKIYYNSGTNKLKLYDGTNWVDLATGASSNTTYDLSGIGSTNGTAGVRLAGSDATNDDVLIVGAGTVGVTRSGNTLTVTGTDSAAGTVTDVAGGTGITITGTSTVTPTVNIDYAGTDNIILVAGDGTGDTLVATDKILFNDATDNNAKFANLSQVATYINAGAGTVTSVDGSGGSTGLTLTGGAITTSGTLTLGGTLATGSGGTGLTTYTTGDILYASNSTTLAKLPIGSTGQVLKVASGIPSWATDQNSGGTVTSITNAAESGTGTAITGAGTFTYTGGTNITTSVSGTTVTINTSATTNVGTVTSVTAGTGMTQSGTSTINPTLNVIGGAGILSLANNIEIDYTSTGIINDANSGTSITLVDADEFLFEDVSSTAGTAVKRGTLSQLKTYIGGSDTTYTLPVSAGGANSAIITLDASAGTDSTVTFNGTTNEIEITESVGNNGSITVGLPDDVTITSDLTVGDNLTLTGGNLSVTGTGSFTGQVTVPLATAASSAPNLGQVELLIAGVGIFQGSYNANTNSPALEGASNIALNTGDYFVVSVSGSFLGEAVEPGDFIFANNDITAGSSPALSNYTVVQADANIAGADTSDGATQKGVAGFDSANFDVTPNGWVQLNSNLSFAGTYPSTTTNTWTVAHGLGTRDVMVQVYEISTGDTVYVDVTRGATSPFALALSTSTSQAANTLRVLVTKIG